MQGSEAVGGAPAAAASGSLPTVPFRIFINYRRSDSGGYAGRIYDALRAHSDAWRVFMDIDTIDPGADFTEVIDRSLEACDVVVAVIGRQWLQSTDARGRVRLEHPDDFVRLELLAALERNVRLIPALVQGADMPSSEDLPEDLAKLARRNALELSDARWQYDIGRLIDALAGVHRAAAQRAAEERVADERAAEERAAGQRAAEERAAEELAAKERAEAERQGRERAERQRVRAEVEGRERERVEREEKQAQTAAPPIPAVPQRDAAARAEEQTGREEPVPEPPISAVAEEAAARSATRSARAAVGGGITAVGSAAFLASIWTQSYDAFAKTYWKSGAASAMILLALLIVLALGASLLLRRRALDLATAAFGLVALGLGLFAPLWSLGPLDSENSLQAGAYLGFLGPLLVAVGAAIAAATHPSGDPARARREVFPAYVLAGVGLALFFAAIWIDIGRFIPTSYWGFGLKHRIGISMIVLTVIAVVALAGMRFLRSSLPETVLAAVGFTALGLAIALPIAAPASAVWHVGAALGFVGPSLVAAGALGIVLDPHSRKLRLTCKACMGLGPVLVTVSIWVPAFTYGSYWNVDGGHRQGIFLLLLSILSAGAIVRSLMTNRRAPTLIAGCLGLVGLGFGLFRAFDVPFALGAGATLALVGSMLLALGAVLALGPTRLAGRFTGDDRGVEIGDAAAWLGSALLVAAIWAPGDARYWARANGGMMLLLVLLCVLTLLGRLLTRDRAYVRATIALGLVLLGFTVNPIVDVEDLGTASWLALGGSILVVAGASAVEVRAVRSRAEATLEAPSAAAT